MASVVGRWGAGLLLLFSGIALVLVLSGTSIRDAINYCREVFSARASGPPDAASNSTSTATAPSSDQSLGESAILPGSETVFDFDNAAPNSPAKRKRSRRTAAQPTPDPVIEESGQLAMPVAQPVVAGANSYKLPELSELKRSPAGNSLDEASLSETGRVLEATLRQFDVDASLSGVTPGPTVTRFEVELAPGVKVAKVKGLSDDIAYALAAERVRIQAPIPGKSAIGFEIPNRQRQLVTLGDILSSAAAKAAQHPLECALGKDIAGRPVTINLAQMPHLLIAGTTGGGKSSTINSFVTSLIMRNGPDRVRLILVDPKRVELGAYDGVPHLLTRVVTNPKKASEALAWAVREMERRYDILAEAGARDLVSYNHSIAVGELKDDMGRPLEAMGYIVVVVDELNDLMMVAARDVEDSIMRLAQMARAVGIHLVIATQRPSTNVITGVIKANIPSRIAFKVGSQVDSRVILDSGGAERLVGMGDMLMLTASSSSARRIQGCFVTEDEVRKVVAHWRRQSEPAYLDAEIFTAGDSGGDSGALGDDDDDLLSQAMELVVRSQLGSTSMLQRKLRVGFARAGRLMDLLERKGVVGPSEGSKARTVLMTVEEFESLASGADEVE
ncbi:MAG: cell division protein FtsK [Acidobacteria bacterium]|nr:MAG: cell division protein FtsK [Acidobacteriota bacterium]